MANHCFNQFNITGNSRFLTEVHDRLVQYLSNPEARDTWADEMYRIADELHICHVEEIERLPFESDFQLRSNEDGSANLIISFTTRWDYDEEFVDCVATVFAPATVEFYADETGQGFAVLYKWENGEITQARVSNDCLYIEDVGDAIRWDDGQWELAGSQATPEEVFGPLVESEDEDQRMTAANHPETPAPLLAKLLTDAVEEVRALTVAHPTVTDAMLEDAVRAFHAGLQDADLSLLSREFLVSYLIDDGSELSTV